MATGTATLDFGASASLGTDYAFVDVTGLTGLTVSSHLEPFVQVESTALNSGDAHRFASTVIRLVAEFLSASSFRIHGSSTVGPVWGTFTVHYATA